MSAQCNLYFKRPAALLAILMPPAAMRSIGSNQVEQLSIAGDSSRVPVPETMCDRRLDTPCMQEPCNIADRATPDDAVASRMYLCYFMHRLLDFRQPEVKALASIAGCHAQTNSDTFGFEKPFGDSKLSPFWYLRLPSEHVAVSILQRSLLVKVSSASCCAHAHICRSVLFSITCATTYFTSVTIMLATQTVGVMTELHRGLG